MHKRYIYILLSGMFLFLSIRMAGQAIMPDNVYIDSRGIIMLILVLVQLIDGRIEGIIQEGYTSNEFEHIWNESDTYLLQVQERSAYGCQGQVISLNVVVNGQTQPELKIPEAFSPNGDLINDVWNIGNINVYPKVEISIYNRWGQSVWRSEKGYPHSWDGTSNGVNLPIDSYHYIIDLHNGSKPIVGKVTIVR